MLRSISKDVVVAAGAENVVDIFTTPKGQNRKVVGLWCEQTATVILRGYRDQEQVVDVNLECNQVLTNGVPADVPIPEGSTFKAGFYHPGAGATMALVVFYEEG